MKLAVISGKGGTGKSSVSAAFLSLSKKTLAVDCDVDASNLYLIFNPVIEGQEVYVSGEHAVVDTERCIRCGQCVSKCNFDAISHYDSWAQKGPMVNELGQVLEDGDVYVDEHACEGCRHCTLVCPNMAVKMLRSDKSRIYTGTYRYGHLLFGRLAPGEENSGKLIDRLKVRAEEMMEQFGLSDMILDGPPGIACPVLATLNGVDKVVIVTEPSLSGFSDLQRVSELAKNFCPKIYVLINKYDLDRENTRMISDWVREHDMQVLGCLPFDVCMTKAMVNAQSVVEAFPESKCALGIREAYECLKKS